MLDLEKIKARCKEGGHYSHWLYVPQLLSEIERLRMELEQINLRISDAEMNEVFNDE